MHLRAPLRRGARHAAVQKSGWVPTNAVSELDNERFLPMQNSLPEFPRVCKPRLHSFFTGICNYASEDNKVFIGPEEFSGIAKRDYRGALLPFQNFRRSISLKRPVFRCIAGPSVDFFQTNPAVPAAAAFLFFAACGGFCDFFDPSNFPVQISSVADGAGRKICRQIAGAGNGSGASERFFWRRAGRFFRK